MPSVCAVRITAPIPDARPTRTDAEFIDCSSASRTVTLPGELSALLLVDQLRNCFIGGIRVSLTSVACVMFCCDRLGSNAVAYTNGLISDPICRLELSARLNWLKS